MVTHNLQEIPVTVIGCPENSLQLQIRPIYKISLSAKLVQPFLNGNKNFVLLHYVERDKDLLQNWVEFEVTIAWVKF